MRNSAKAAISRICSNDITVRQLLGFMSLYNQVEVQGDSKSLQINHKLRVAPRNSLVLS